MILKLTNEKITVTVDSRGAELVSSVGADGFEYVWSGDAWGEHAPLLFPICGRILNGEYTSNGKKYAMKAHGFAKYSEFDAETVSGDRIVLTLRSDEETRRLYPFNFTLTATYALDGDRLTAEFEVRNTGDCVMPYMFGWHPGFRLGGSADIGRFTLELGEKCAPVMHPLANGPFLSDKELPFPLDNGKYALNEAQMYGNDTLILTGTDNFCILSGEGDSHSVTLEWSKNLPYFCIWKAPDTRARFICLEPWSDVPADGVTPENFDTRRMSRLYAGMSEIYRYSVRFS